MEVDVQLETAAEALDHRDGAGLAVQAPRLLFQLWGRRMAEHAATLVDDLLPRVPVRQWVLTLPYRLRYHLACTGSRRVLMVGKLRVLTASPRRLTCEA